MLYNTKHVLIFMSILMVGACSSTSSEQLSGDTYKLTYDPPLEDYLTASSRPTTYTDGQLTAEAIKQCPEGYKVIDNKHIISPPDNSRIEWTIKCLPN